MRLSYAKIYYVVNNIKKKIVTPTKLIYSYKYKCVTIHKIYILN